MFIKFQLVFGFACDYHSSASIHVCHMDHVRLGRPEIFGIVLEEKTSSYNRRNTVHNCIKGKGFNCAIGRYKTVIQFS